MIDDDAGDARIYISPRKHCKLNATQIKINLNMHDTGAPEEANAPSSLTDLVFFSYLI